MARKSSVTPEKKAEILKDLREGTKVADASKKYGVSVPTLYLWQREKGGTKKKTATRTVAKRSSNPQPQSNDAGLETLMEDLSFLKRLKELLAEFGYIKNR